LRLLAILRLIRSSASGVAVAGMGSPTTKIPPLEADVVQIEGVLDQPIWGRLLAPDRYQSNRALFSRMIGEYPTEDMWANLKPAPHSGDGLAGGRVVLKGRPRVARVGGAGPGDNWHLIP
jgi:hypothetical protein